MNIIKKIKINYQNHFIPFSADKVFGSTKISNGKFINDNLIYINR